ncbi:hypothetical protein A2U01_0038886, partial [Trifolium medium]|nr:hypothetical protein [Trifolium medium]
MRKRRRQPPDAGSGAPVLADVDGATPRHAGQPGRGRTYMEAYCGLGHSGIFIFN